VRLGLITKDSAHFVQRVLLYNYVFFIMEVFIVTFKQIPVKNNNSNI